MDFSVYDTVMGIQSEQATWICLAVSVILGIATALLYTFRNTYSQNFVLTLCVLPAIVQVVILLVNGNLGAGVAVAGAFSLIRFRSVAGGAREITAIFLATAIGIADGMGYVLVAFTLYLTVAAVTILLSVLGFGQKASTEKELKIVIPETLDYTGLFDDLFALYAVGKPTLVKVKTTNMGSLYELHYRIVLKDAAKEKEMIDAIRCRNGNLNIVCGRVSTVREEL